jgi:hypothetical protein
VLHQLVQIDAQKLEDQAQMVPEKEEVTHPDDVMPVIRVSTAIEKLQHAYFDSCLQIEEEIDR